MFSMNKKCLTIILAFIIMIGAIPVFAEPDENEESEEFVTDENGVLIEYNGEGGNIAVPDGVTSIGVVFSGDKRITSVMLPDSITELYERVFEGCTILQSVMFKSATPPELAYDKNIREDNAFFINTPDLTTLYVRIGAKEAYEAEEMFGDYDIVEIKFCEYCNEYIGFCECNLCETCGKRNCEIDHFYCDICGDLDCEIDHYCEHCGAVDCKLAHFYCDDCGTLDCTGQRGLGEILGKGSITMLDIMELIKYLTGVKSKLDDGSDSCSFKAALILGGEMPTHWDLAEMYAHISGFPCAIDGAEPLVNIPKNQITVRAEIDEANSEIRYYANQPLIKHERYAYEVTVKGSNLQALKSTYNFYNENQDDIFRVVLGAGSDIPTNERFMFQPFAGNARGLTVTGDGITEVIALPRMGDIDGDGKVTIFDALEILKKLIKIKSKVDTCEFSFKASLIKKGIAPTIFDTIEILKYVLGIPNEVDPTIRREPPQYR